MGVKEKIAKLFALASIGLFSLYLVFVAWLSLDIMIDANEGRINFLVQKCRGIFNL